MAEVASGHQLDDRSNEVSVQGNKRLLISDFRVSRLDVTLGRVKTLVQNAHDGITYL